MLFAKLTTLPSGIRRAILNYYFAASGNDSTALMALGYRHMHGLRVPRSCQTAVLYYNPLAEQVVDLARYPGSLPAVRSVVSKSLPQPWVSSAHSRSPIVASASFCPHNWSIHTGPRLCDARSST